MSKYDCIVVGYGPCGISTAIYLKRYGYNPLVIGKDNGALDKAHLIENYYGFENPISGPQLIENGIKQYQNLGGTIITDEVVGLTYEDKLVVKGMKENYKGDIAEFKNITFSSEPDIDYDDYFASSSQINASNLQIIGDSIMFTTNKETLNLLDKALVKPSAYPI